MKKGFTLIELLIVFSLIGILFSVGIAYYQRFNRKQVLFQAARTVKNDLRLVQSKALAGEKDCEVCGGSNGVCDNNADDKSLTGWVFQFQVDRYEYHGSCGDPVLSFYQTPKFLPTGINFTRTDPSYTFSPLGRSYASNFTVCLEDEESNTYKLEINQGEIKDENKISTNCQ